MIVNIMKCPMKLPEDPKEDIGCSQSLFKALHRTSPPGSPIAKANWKLGKAGSLIGRFCAAAIEAEEEVGSERRSDPFTASLLDHLPPETMFGRRLLESPEPDSSSDENPFKEVNKKC